MVAASFPRQAERTMAATNNVPMILRVIALRFVIPEGYPTIDPGHKLFGRIA